MTINCPQCGKDLVYGIMSPNNLFAIDLGGVFCSVCDFHDQIDNFYTNYINSGIQQVDEMDNFKKYLISNNERLNISTNTKRAIMKQ